MITMVRATLVEAWRWIRGDIEEPDVPESQTVKWLREIGEASRQQREQRDWLETAWVDQRDRRRAIRDELDHG